VDGIVVYGDIVVCITTYCIIVYWMVVDGIIAYCSTLY